MRRMLLSFLFATVACSNPAECEPESMTFRETVARSEDSQINELTEDGWDCTLLSSMPDPIFGLGLVLDWQCTRCR